MIKRAIILVFCFGLSTLVAQTVEHEKKAIQEIIQTAYVEGLQNEGDIEKIDSGIHPGFQLIGIGENDQLWTLPIDEWKERTEKKKKEGVFPRTGKEKVSIKFLSVDVTGTAAVAKIEFYVGASKKYVDYISLYKFSDGWKMVNKIFYKFED